MIIDTDVRNAISTTRWVKQIISEWERSLGLLRREMHVQEGDHWDNDVVVEVEVVMGHVRMQK